MATTAQYVPFLAIIILILQSNSASANLTFPFLPPFFDNVCKEVVCGKGKCVVSYNSAFGFECQCENGWKQTRSHNDDFLSFLPCVIPNCTLSYHCAKAPAPDHRNKSNASIFDPCFWSHCGGGSCNKTSMFTRSCECDEGYYNLFNSTAFPCFKECSIGGDCENLGINIGSNTTSSEQRPNATDTSSNHVAVTWNPRGGSRGFIIAFTTLFLVRKYV